MLIFQQRKQAEFSLFSSQENELILADFLQRKWAEFV